MCNWHKEMHFIARFRAHIPNIYQQSIQHFSQIWADRNGASEKSPLKSTILYIMFDCIGERFYIWNGSTYSTFMDMTRGKANASWKSILLDKSKINKINFYSYVFGSLHVCVASLFFCQPLKPINRLEIVLRAFECTRCRRYKWANFKYRCNPSFLFKYSIYKTRMSPMGFQRLIFFFFALSCTLFYVRFVTECAVLPLESIEIKFEKSILANAVQAETPNGHIIISNIQVLFFFLLLFSSS